MPKFLSVFENGIFLIVVFLLAFIPLYPKFPLIGVNGTFVSVRVEDLIIAFALFLWVVYIVVSGGVKKFFNDRLNQSLLLFFFIGALSLFSAIFLTKTVVPSLGIFHFLRRIELMMLLPLTYSIIKNKKQVVVVLSVLAIAVFLVDVYAVGQKYLHWPVISTDNSEFSRGIVAYLTPDARVNSTFAGPYDLAVFLAMFLAAFTAVFFSIKKIQLKFLSIILAGLSSVVLVLTAARLSFASVVVGVIVSLLLTGKKIFIILFMVIVVLGVLIPSPLRDRLFSTVKILIPSQTQRYIPPAGTLTAKNQINIPNLPHPVATSSAASTESAKAAATISAKPYTNIVAGEPVDKNQLDVFRSLNIRLVQEWPRAIRALIKNPLLGTGYSSLGLATDNDFLRSLGEVGLLGSAAFALILIEISKRVWKNFRSEDKFIKYFSAGALSIIIAFVLNALFIDVFEASKVASIFWMILGVSLATEKFKT
ncbi:MAG: O-antigen ligase family protein [Patescibacteria group bacterium]|nr:O-antigen ligase family protein [Patescibacteria group bacterium]